MSTKILTKDKSNSSPILDDEDVFAMAAGAGYGGSGNSGGGIGGGGGSPGGGTPGGGGSGGGGNGGKPGGEGFGNNLSFPAVFFNEGAPVLRGNPDDFTFTTPTLLGAYPGQVFFAQGVEGNEWQAGSITVAGPVTVDYVDIGDALESAPLKSGTNVRLELTLYEELTTSLTGFSMTLLGGAKGSGKPTVKGPTESQGAQLAATEWGSGGPYNGNSASAPDGTTYDSMYASIYAAISTGGETTNSYMSMSIQKVTGLDSAEGITGLTWNGSQWVEANTGDDITVGANLFNTDFGPELNIGGKYIMGASGKPFKFTSDGDYLITFALDEGAPLVFDGSTEVANFGFVDGSPVPGVAAGRETVVYEDGATHNGLLVMLVGVPSSVPEGGGEGD